MKIAIFSDSFPPIVDGVANVVYSSAVELGRLGHETYVFTVSRSAQKRQAGADSFKDKGFTLIRLPSVPALAYPGYRVGLPTGIVFNKLRKIRPDIIHTHTPFSVGWEAILSAKFFHIPVVGTHHTFYDHYLKYVKLDYSWGEKFSWKYIVGYYNMCDLVLSPSKSLAGELARQGLRKPIKVLSNPVNTEVFKPISSLEAKKRLKESFGIGGPSLIYMGRVSYEKSIDQVLAAVAQVAKKIPSIKLVIVGDGPERDNLESLAAELGIKDNIVFSGFRHNQDLVESLQASDVFLTASKSETFALSVLEAMSTGLPIVAVDALAIPETVKDGINGFLVAPDQPGEMAEKILALVENESLIEKFSRASRELALGYSQQDITLSLQKIYTKLISRP